MENIEIFEVTIDPIETIIPCYQGFYYGIYAAPKQEIAEA